MGSLFTVRERYSCRRGAKSLALVLSLCGAASCDAVFIETDPMEAGAGGQGDDTPDARGGSTGGGRTGRGGAGARAGSGGGAVAGRGGTHPGGDEGPSDGGSEGGTPNVGAGGVGGEGPAAGVGGALEPASLSAPELRCWHGTAEAGAGGAAPENGYFAADVLPANGQSVALDAINRFGETLLTVATPDYQVCRPFYWNGAQIEALPGIPEAIPCVYGVDIADSGEILLGRSVLPVSQPLLWKDGRVSELEGVERGWPRAINTRQQVLYSDGYDRGFIWEAGTITPLTLSDGSPLSPVAINNLGQVLAQRGDLEHSFVWDAGVVTPLPFFDAVAINDLGQVIGYFRDGASGPGVLNEINVGVYEGGVLTPFDTGQVWTTGDRDREAHLFGMGESGELVGEIPPFSGVWPVPFLRTAEGETVRLPVVFAGEAREISDAGVVLGVQYTVQGAEPTFENFRSTIWSPECLGSCCD